MATRLRFTKPIIIECVLFLSRCAENGYVRFAQLTTKVSQFATADIWLRTSRLTYSKPEVAYHHIFPMRQTSRACVLMFVSVFFCIALRASLLLLYCCCFRLQITAGNIGARKGQPRPPPKWDDARQRTSRHRSARTLRRWTPSSTVRFAITRSRVRLKCKRLCRRFLGTKLVKTSVCFFFT